ncbi:MAG TPA: FHA domain-containing protein [Phycisphaerae bacterium]|nr:FHA domain-containing protein [Phycisphaerae bacterium]
MDIKLVIFRENGERRDFAIGPGTTVIGRKEDCAIRIPVLEVSRHHVELRIGEKGVHFRDLGSANGTYVNNKRVAKGALQAGDHLIVGPVVFTVQVDGNPDEIRAVRTRLRSRAAAQSGAEAAVTNDEDPISALEALASSADQTALDPFDEEEEEEA